jgi:CTP:molybdopterin cytidylyltransferase MocA
MGHRAESDIPIILLAAGQSKRMLGRDKLLEEIDGAPLLWHQARKARRATRGPVLVALPPKPHERYAALTGCDVVCVPIADAATGMSASLKGALHHLPAEAKAVMILLADLPDLTAADLARVLSDVDLASDTLIWRGTTAEGAPGHPIVFAAPLFDGLKAITGDHGGAEVVRANRHLTHFVPLPDAHALRDLDTPEDWADWRKSRTGAPE